MDEQQARRRFIELYNDGVSYNKFARDEQELCQTLFPGAANERARAWRCWELASHLTKQGFLTARRKTEPALKEEWGSEETPFAKYLERYEKLIGAPEKRKVPTETTKTDRYEAIIFSDPHLPDVRMKLLDKLVQRFAGLPCIIAGDISNFDEYSKYSNLSWHSYTLEDWCAANDAFFDIVSKHFPDTTITLGNHDNRLITNALRKAGKDYAWMSYQFLLWAYEKRHGIKVIRNRIQKENGQEIPGLHFYLQIGDCVIGHVERSGKAASKGAELAHDFYFSWQDVLGLAPFRVILQAHTHKTNYSRHSLTGAHLYEIGALADLQNYALQTQRFSRIQAGAFHLVQQSGHTLINESRLIALDEAF